MNTKIYMGISYKDIGFYTYPPCEIFIGEWKNGKQISEGKYMYWAIKDDGYSEAKYLSGTLLKIEKIFGRQLN